MRVLWMLSSVAMGGGERNLVSVLPYLRDGGADVILCTLNTRRDSPLAGVLAESGIQRFDLGARRMSDPGAWRRFTRLLSSLDVDLLHASDQDTIIWAGLAHRLRHIPTVMTRHVLEEPVGTGKERVRAELVLRSARFGMDGIIAVSESVRQRFVRQSHVPPERIETIYNGIELERFRTGARRGEIRSRLGWAADRPIAILVSVMRPGKGFEVLFEAMPRILAAIPGLQVKLVGDGPLADNLRELASPLGSAVEFMGQRMDVPELLGASDLLIQASWSEALPTVLIEAGAAALPVVATDVGGSSEIVQHGEGGFIVAPGDALALAERTIELLRSPTLARQLGNHACDYVNKTFSLPVQAAKTMAFYEKVIAGARENPV